MRKWEKMKNWKVIGPDEIPIDIWEWERKGLLLDLSNGSLLGSSTGRVKFGMDYILVQHHFSLVRYGSSLIGWFLVWVNFEPTAALSNKLILQKEVIWRNFEFGSIWLSSNQLGFWVYFGEVILGVRLGTDTSHMVLVLGCFARYLLRETFF